MSGLDLPPHHLRTEGWSSFVVLRSLTFPDPLLKRLW